MPQSASDVVAAEIEALDKKLPTLFERDDKFFAHISKGENHVVSNRDFRVPLKIRPGGVTRGYDPDNGSLGTGSGSVLANGTIPQVHLLHAISWNEAVRLGTDSPKKSVAQVVKQNLAEGMQEFRRNLDSLCVGGGNGVLGTVSTLTGASRRVTLSNDGFGTRLIREGMEVSTYNSGLSTKKASGDFTVKTVDHENRYVTFEGTGTIALPIATDKLCLSGLSGTPPKSIYGVQYHHDNASTGTWINLSRATYPQVRCNRVNGGSASLTLAGARLAVNKIAIRAGAKEGMMGRVSAWMHNAQSAAYEALGQGVQRIIMDGKNSGNLDLYFNGGQTLAGASVRVHPNWDKTRVDFISDKNWARAEVKPIGFYGKQHGRKVFEGRGSDGGVTASWHSFITVGMNVYVHNPLEEAYIDSLTFASGY